MGAKKKTNKNGVEKKGPEDGGEGDGVNKKLKFSVIGRGEGQKGGGKFLVGHLRENMCMGKKK